jgi:predicted ATP-dependent serine protease
MVVRCECGKVRTAEIGKCPKCGSVETTPIVTESETPLAALLRRSLEEAKKKGARK